MTHRLKAIGLVMALLGAGPLGCGDEGGGTPGGGDATDGTEDTGTEDTDTEDTGTEDTDTGDTDTEDTDTEDTSTEDTSTEDTSTEDTDTEETDTEDTDTEDTNTEETDTEDTDTEDTDTEDTGTEDTGTAVEVEVDCADEVDDDDDGLLDCDDPDCELTTECSPVCAPVDPIACGETVAAATDAEGSTSVLAQYPCADGFYTGSEIAWTVTVDEPTIVAATLDNKQDQTDLLVIEGLGGACFAQRCLEQSVEGAVFLAVPGTEYMLVVDGLDGAVGSFDLSLTCEACVADCTDKVCGGDGCGSECGACGEGETCSPDGAACLVPPANDTCATATVIDAVPFTASGDTTEALDDVPALGLFCSDAALSASPDVAYAITPESNEVFEIALSGLEFDAALAVVTDCGDAAGSCLAGSDEFDDEWINVGLVAGTTYYILVDGVSDLDTGSYTLDVYGTGECFSDCSSGCGVDDGCGELCPCVSNDTCAEAEAIDLESLPAVITASSQGASDDYEVLEGTCPGAPDFYTFGDGGPDVVYSLTPTEAGSYTFSIPLGSSTAFDAALYVVTDCADVATTCLAGDEFIGLGGEAVSLELEGGTTYFVIVDGYKEDFGVFELHIDTCVPACGGGGAGDVIGCGSDGCGGSCGTCEDGEFCAVGTCTAQPANEDCTGPAVIDGPGFTVVSTTLGANDDFVTACGALWSDSGEDNGDLTWTYTPADNETVTFRVEPIDEDWEPVVAVTTDCLDPGAGCLDGAFGGYDLAVSLEAGTTYTIIVDGDYPADDEGVFELSMCPECAEGEVCTQGQCAAPPDACEGITVQGCCDGSVLHYCNFGEIVSSACVESCGWDPEGGDSGWYDCSFEGADPSGENPIECPGE